VFQNAITLTAKVKQCNPKQFNTLTVVCYKLQNAVISSGSGFSHLSAQRIKYTKTENIYCSENVKNTQRHQNSFLHYNFQTFFSASKLRCPPIFNQISFTEYTGWAISPYPPVFYYVIVRHAYIIRWSSIPVHYDLKVGSILMIFCPTSG